MAYDLNGLSSVTLYIAPADLSVTNSLAALLDSQGGGFYKYSNCFAGMGTNTYFIWSVARCSNNLTNASDPVSVKSTVSNVLVDKTPPVISITAPGANQVVGNNYAFYGTAVDTGVGVDKVYVSLGGWVYGTASYGSGNWSTNISVSIAGYYTNFIYAVDLAGNCSATNSVSVQYIAGMPSVNIISPVSGILTNVSVINVSGNASVSPGSIAKVELKVNGGSYGDVGNTTWQTNNVSLSEGTNVLMARAVSINNVTNTSGSNIVIADTGRPTVAFVTPTNGQSIGFSTVTVGGTASDAVSGVKQVYLAVDSGSFSLANGTANWSTSLTLPMGTYTIKAYAVDNAGNVSATNSITIYRVDITAPSLLVTGPANGASFNTSNITATGTASDSESGVEGVYLSVDSGSFTKAAGTASWSSNLVLTNGSHTISVYSKDVSGNVSATTNILVTVNTGGVSSNIVVHFKKPTAWPGAYIHIWNTVYTTTWSNCPAMTSEGGGWYMFVLTNATNASLLFKDVSGTNVTDNSHQTIDLSRNKDGWFLTNGNLSGGKVDGNWFDSNPDGADTTPPVANFTSPTNNQTVSTNTAVSGTASDNASGVKEVWLKIDSGAFGKLSGTTAWSTNLGLSAGVHSFQVYAIDYSNNISITNQITNITASSSMSNAWPGTYSGKLGANVYADGVEFSIWWQSSVVDGVSVIGTFNSRNRNVNPMTYIPSGGNTGVWYAFVPGAKVGDEYMYSGHKLGAGGYTEVADPYAKYNRYSGGNSVVCDTNFNWTDGSWTRPGWGYYIIYELHTKDFTSTNISGVSSANRGKYLGITEKLSYLTNLGITAIELMPISEFPDAGYSWGYNTSIFSSVESGYAVNPYNAQDGLDEFRTLVNTCHQYGVAVIVDMVFNHTANNDNWLWVIDSASYFNGTSPWGNKLNTPASIVHRLAKDCLEYFMRVCHVDGFRFDATHTDYMDHDFVRDIKTYCSGIDPNVYFVYENLPNQTDLKTYGAQWACNYRNNAWNALCGWNGANASTVSSGIYYSKDDGFASCPVEALNYFESHDEDTLAYKMNIAGFDDGKKKARTRLAIVMLATSLGNPMIWMGQEFLRSRQGQNINEWPLDWSLATTYSDVLAYYSGVLKLRKNNPALRQNSESGFAWQYTPWTGDSMVIGYSLTDGVGGDKKFCVLLNFDQSSSKTVTLGFPANGTWTEVVTEGSVNGTGTISVSGNSASVTIGANSGIIFMQ